MKLFLILPMILVVTFFIYCIKVIKRHWIDKRGFSAGTEMAAKSVYEKFLNKQKQQGVQHIRTMKEAKKEDDDGSKFDELN